MPSVDRSSIENDCGVSQRPAWDLQDPSPVHKAILGSFPVVEVKWRRDYHATHSLEILHDSRMHECSRIAFEHNDERSELFIGKVEVGQGVRRKGLATLLYRFLMEDLFPGYVIVSTELTPGGQRLVRALPTDFFRIDPRMLSDPLPEECNGLLIDNSFSGRLEIFHSRSPLLVHQSNDFCRVHECTCGSTSDDADEAEEVMEDHLDGTLYDPWSGHEFECAARLVVPRAMSLTCGCDDHDEDDEWDAAESSRSRRPPSLKRMRDALKENDVEAVGKPLRELTSEVRDKTVDRLVRDHRKRYSIDSRDAPNAFTPGIDATRFGWERAHVLDPDGTWEALMDSGWPVPAGIVPGCVPYEQIWGRVVTAAAGVMLPSEGHRINRCPAARAR